MDLDEFIEKINQLCGNRKLQPIVCFEEQVNHAYGDIAKNFLEIKISLEKLLEVAVDDILDEFQKQVDGVGTHCLDAKDKAEDLLKKLKGYKKQAFEKISRESLSTFSTESKKAIQDAMPILQRDLGWGDYLLNLAKKLINAATTAISFVVTLGTSNHHGFFALKPSSAVNTAQQLLESICGMNNR